MNCKICHRKANIHWVNEGDLCSNCFTEKYTKEYGVSEKDKRIEENFEKTSKKAESED